jgi:hypothetical protein
LVLARVSNISMAGWFAAHVRLFVGLMLCGGVSFLLMNVIENVLLGLILSVSGGLLVNGVWLLITGEPSLQEALEFGKKLFKRWI